MMDGLQLTKPAIPRVKDLQPDRAAVLRNSIPASLRVTFTLGAAFNDDICAFQELRGQD
jgi:hypothetical protein